MKVINETSVLIRHGKEDKTAKAITTKARKDNNSSAPNSKQDTNNSVIVKMAFMCRVFMRGYSSSIQAAA